MSGHRVEASRLVDVEPKQAFDRLIAARLPEVFRRRHAAFPSVREVTDEPDEWGTVGHTRTIVLADEVTSFRKAPPQVPGGTDCSPPAIEAAAVQSTARR